MQKVITASSQTLADKAQYPALALFIQSLGYLPGRRYYPGDRPEKVLWLEEDLCNGDY